jgi:hypothetical protein
MIDTHGSLRADVAASTDDELGRLETVTAKTGLGRSMIDGKRTPARSHGRAVGRSCYCLAAQQCRGMDARTASGDDERGCWRRTAQINRIRVNQDFWCVSRSCDAIGRCNFCN